MSRLSERAEAGRWPHLSRLYILDPSSDLHLFEQLGHHRYNATATLKVLTRHFRDYFISSSNHAMPRG
jgi:hypothetical protein